MNNHHLGRMGRKQSGAALVVALIVLATVTVIGVSNMQSSNLEMKMIASSLDRNFAFSITESALVAFEQDLENTVDRLDDLYTDVCTVSEFCFDPTCEGGLCFAGDYRGSDVVSERADCSLEPAGGNLSLLTPWKDQTLWNDNARHFSRVVNVAGDDYEVKGIYEFLCFVSSLADTPMTVAPNTGNALFRVTAYFDGGDRRSPVMLQSTYSYWID